jgi:glycosyltransferase involved in cell wall biosynthesis
VRVLFLNKYTALGPSSRYRVLQFLPFLEKRGMQADVHSLHDDHYLASRYSGGKTSPFYLASRMLSRLSVLAGASRYDLVFIQKEMLPHFIDLPEWFLWRNGVRYVVDLDDAIHLMYPDGLLKGKIPRVLSRAHMVLAGNRYLEDYARRYNENVVFFPTVVDTDRMHPRDSADRKDVVVGWMGTPETVKYLTAILPAVENAASGTPVSLLVVGAPVPPTHGIRATSKAWSDAEASDLRAMDIGLMPLADDEWSKGKCALKLLQYMSAGVASVTSPAASAPEFVRDGENAWMARDVNEWRDRIDRLARSAGLRAEMGARARVTVEEGYSLRVWGPRFVDALEWAAGDGRTPLPWKQR